MQPNNFTITGHIIDRQTDRGISGLRIEAWDKDLFFDDLVGSAETDTEGFFEIRFNEEHFKELIARRPDLYLKLYSEDEAIPGEAFDLTVTPPHGEPLTGSGDSVFWKLAPGETNVSIRLAMPAASQTFKVKGTILQPDGTPVVGAIVKAFDKSIRTETLLGEATTNKAGQYEIAYRAETFLQSGKKRPDLIVRVFDQEGEEIASTKEPIYNARQIEEVNLVVGNAEYKGPSEYERILDALSPLLKDLELSELTDDDVEFLAGKTGISSEQIIYLVLAARYSKKTDLPSEIFYGLFRQNFPTSLPALLAQNSDIQESALEAAVRDNIIPETIPVEQVLERFQSLIVEHAFEPLEPLPTGKTTIGALIGSVQITPQQQREFLNLYVSHKGSIEEFWQGLEETELQPSVQELQYTLQLGVLTGNHLPLVQHVKQLDSISTLRDLAGLELDEWKGMVQTHGFPPDVPGKDDEEKADYYAQTIFRMIEDAFPTAVVAHKLHGDVEFEIPFREEISNFLLNTPEFEFGKTQIDTYLKENPDTFTGVEDQEGVIRQFKTMDRHFRISPRFERYEAMKVLMENGFNSAQSIAMMGQRSFSTQYAEKLGNYHKAKAVYTNAVQMTAMTLNLQAKYSRAFNQLGMYVLPDIAKKMQEVIPDWETLFGPFQLCDCEHCESVYSPSAYLVDLLAFLRNHNLEKHISGGPYSGINSALGVLSDRRHDIEHINLSCENTDTPVPYVDLVNEVLESAVSYSPAYYQTTGTADELGANPEYLNTDAYDRLAETIYPWSLPFDLWTEEARTYLNHLGASRCSLMETFRKNGEASEADDYAIACEYLGMTTTEWQIITGTTSHDSKEFWGMSEADWVDKLSEVPTFLEKSGLTYKELDELFNTRFINPGRFEPETAQPEIEITFKDAFCNIETATITNLNPETLNKIHRFVRLWRKLGWSAKELDMALSVLITPHLESIKIDEPFLLKLWHLLRLHSNLKIPAANLFSFWSAINTYDYEGQITSLYDQLFLNKAVLNPEDEIFRLNDERNELSNPHEQITDYAEGIQAALGISDAELSLLLEESEVPDMLNLANLSHLYRIVIFSKALKLSIDEFIATKKLFGIDPFLDPFDPEHLEVTLQFAEKAQKIRESGFSISELEYLLHHRCRESEGIAPREEEIALVLGEIRDGLQKIAEENSMAPDPDGELTTAKLTWLEWDEPLIGEVVGTLNGSVDYEIDLDSLPDETYLFDWDKVPGNDNERFIGYLRNDLGIGWVENAEILKSNDGNTISIFTDEDSVEIIIDETSKIATIKINDVEMLDLIVKSENGKRNIYVEGFKFPTELQDKIHYDADNGKLHFVGLMSEGDKTTLLELSPEQTYTDAIEALYEKPKTFISERMKAFVLPPFWEPLGNLPPEVVIPDELKEKIYYDKNDRKLFFIGWMTEAERDTLCDLMPEHCERKDVNGNIDEEKCRDYEEERNNYIDVIENLFDAPFNYIPYEENQFLKEEDISKLLEASNIAARFEIILEILLPYIQNIQSKSFVIQKIADALKLEAKTAEQLLTHYVILPADYESGEKAIDILLLIDFAESNPNVNLTFEVFPDQFNAYVLLHKIALIITKLRITVDGLPLLFQKNPDVWDDRGWADLNFLPLIAQAGPSALFGAAEKLFDLFSFRDHLLPGEPTLFEILDMAFNPDGNTLEDFLKPLSERMGWNLEDLLQLAGWFGFDLVDFEHTETLVKLMPCFDVLKRLGVSAEKVCDWITVPEEFDEAMDKAYQTARSIKQAAKAKYDNERWLEVAKPLRDDLREKQRSALVSYLIAHYAFPDKTFKDSNDLYAHFLIDPEMAPCMMTSRLKLATSTVQLFVQRCLMNLEEWKIPNASIAQEWSSQWQWMKNYRVWEANRKVFLYPENWIEPELRDDKSPFFKDLENELLQNEVTSDHVEKVFLNYLEKLDAVARLEICGMYHEVEKEAPGGIGKNAIDTLHVFGRTRGIPHIYYYRRRIATGGKTMYWTPWEKVDLDIEGDHLIPVVWNRRLYLFWPIFTEKAKKGGEQGEEPSEYWEIKLAWSEYKNGKWSAKEVTPEPEIPEDRNTDEIKKKWAGGNNWPMHLSQSNFAFKGFVLNESFILQCLIHEHKTLIDSGIAMGTYPLFNIEFIGCQGRIIQSDIPPGLKPLSFPYGMDAKGMELIECADRDEEDNFFLGDTILEKTPGIFHLLFPHQYYRFISQDSFLFQDDTGTFFVAPRGTGISDQPGIYDPSKPEFEWHNPDEVQVEDIDSYLPDYFEIIPEYEHWEEMHLPPTEMIDPPVIETTFPAGAYDETIGQTTDYGFYGTRAGAEGRMLTRSETSSHITENTSMAMAHASLATAVSERTYLFETFYHPYVCEFVKYLNRDGIDGLLQRPVQLLNSLLFTFAFEGGLDALIVSGVLKEQFEKNGYPLSKNAEIPTVEPIIIHDRGFIYRVIKHGSMIKVYKDLFADIYQPTDVVDKPYPYEDVDFSPEGAYSLYNWEIFFHAPLMVADRLSSNQRFADAQKWFHYIFDPTDTSTHDVPQKYWKLRPFFEVAEKELSETLEELLTKEKDELEKQVNEWRDNPFKPHLIARMRLVAYQKTVVMKYIDNLIAWGDQLFRRDSIESINEATQLYILAAEILGKRPENIPPHTEPPVKTFNDLTEEELDAFSNAMVEAENYILSPRSAASLMRAGDMQMFGPSFYLCCPAAREGEEDKDVLYFCIPKNQKLLSYWDTVADRLFKIRHCMTIEGVVRRLPLFEPPIEPGLLVRAVAAGVDIGSALNDLNAPLPHYRFQYMLQKAIELCGDVRSLGASLLSALEKRDAEELSLLRSGHEVQLLKAIKQIKKQNIDEANETLKGAKQAREAAEIRYEYYKNIEKMNDSEKLHLSKLASAQILQSIGQGYDVAASIAHLIPEFTAGFCTGTTSGGSNVGSALRAYGGVYSFLASIESYQANKASILGSHERRWDDWKLQEKLAETEIKQIDKQILAAEIRKAVAEKDLENHNMQIENAEEAKTFMKDKFTNQELYNWMVSQISTLYFQSYQMAYDIAKRAEKAFRQELGDFDASFVKFGYWDNLKKGLLSGEQLHYDLKRMETAYLDKNKREFELTKHISLAMLDPMALVKLKETGQCFVNLPEALFDLEYPGHYMRRIKSVSLTIPCVTGPYTNVSCTLTLLNNSVRMSSIATDAGDYPRIENDSRFRDNIGAIQSIATSSAQNDSGVFELNFRDERYLPFESAGAISSWRLEMPKKFEKFDYSTISDAIIHLRYTARDGGNNLKAIVENGLQKQLNELLLSTGKTGLFKGFNIRHEFPNEWHNLKQNNSTAFTLTKQHLPQFVQEYGPRIDSVTWYARVKDNPDSFEMFLDGTSFSLDQDPSLNNLNVGESELITLGDEKEFTLSADNTENLEELVMLIKYTLDSRDDI